MQDNKNVCIFWFRRDLRLEDNAGLYHALRSGVPVLPLFIFDTNILDKLEDRDDARVTFIYHHLDLLNTQLKKLGIQLLIKHNSPENAWKELLDEYEVKAIYTNNDYEPYASKRDSIVKAMAEEKGAVFHSFKDQVIFEKNEVVKSDGSPYTVFTAYKRKWLEKLRPEFHLKPYPIKKYAGNFLQAKPTNLPPLDSLGFTESLLEFPDKEYQSIIDNYNKTRDFPAIEGTSKISVHLRFGTVSIRELAADAYKATEQTWLSELVWRDFYAMILWHFPYSATSSFKKDFDNIKWKNDEEEFSLWCEGKTGYPIVDAGMRQLNKTGWMHNRVRMIVASFLCKHLLIDWRWGEAYFARKLIDYDMASNVGGWQWAAGTGNDAAPYFRVFNPDLQTKRFDPKLHYVKKWVPEFNDPFKYRMPVVNHQRGRDRALKQYKLALEK